MTEHDGRGGASPAAVAMIVARLYRQLAQASADDLNLTYAQLSALARIRQYGPIRLGELAALEQIAAPTLTRTVRPLAEAGLIGKEPDPSDGRSWLVSIHEEGRALIDRIRRERAELLARRMARLTAEQREALDRALPVLEELLTEGAPPPDGEPG
ncbi:putative MarR family transcriptional regulator [Actinacidiphila reveromycinica]|uniref:Putative MarR family transcriptional regulator n=1 Tax=Actinacidiphila reveromycinica TaxID=659352 RepID=A0A7U3UNM0_9ACTN|nr:MarR family transcriptional regulator [Streptomyces sp. SN-593]BBA95882.1 putative MarR family transcriptional regulator [Streptomyces sp. SN-593]